jgi:hypothetical protein
MAAQDYYEGQAWKAQSHRGVINVLIWCVRNTRVSDLSVEL